MTKTLHIGHVHPERSRRVPFANQGLLQIRTGSLDYARDDSVGGKAL